MGDREQTRRRRKRKIQEIEEEPLDQIQVFPEHIRAQKELIQEALNPNASKRAHLRFSNLGKFPDMPAADYLIFCGADSWHSEPPAHVRKIFTP